LKINSQFLLGLLQASAEVQRLTKLKASRMKELVMKKRSELEEICRMTHIEPDSSTAAEKSSALIDSGKKFYFPP
jgi:protein regulator of cytokinesis 1